MTTWLTRLGLRFLSTAAYVVAAIWTGLKMLGLDGLERDLKQHDPAWVTTNYFQTKHYVWYYSWILFWSAYVTWLYVVHFKPLIERHIARDEQIKARRLKAEADHNRRWGWILTTLQQIEAEAESQQAAERRRERFLHITSAAQRYQSWRSAY